MAKNTVSSETTSRPPRITDTTSGQTLPRKEASDLPPTIDKNILNYIELVHSRLQGLESAFPELKKKTDTQFRNFKRKSEVELGELRSRSDRTIETIGIFAALLSFVTFEAQIFKSDLNGFTLIGLSSLLLGALLIFVFALSNAFNPSKRENWKSYLQPLVVLPALLVLFGLGTASVGYKTDSQEAKEIEQIQDEIKTLKLQYSEDNIEIMERINEIENTLNELLNEDQSRYLEDFKDCVATRGLTRCL